MQRRHEKIIPQSDQPLLPGRMEKAKDNTHSKDIYNISSYRPTSLIPVLAKLASSLVKARLTRTIKRLKLIPAMSMGFKKGEAATTCVNYKMNHKTREKARQRSLASLN
jgi:hypothetical protein